MAEYVALVVVVLGLMIYLLNLAFNLNDNYDPLKMFLIGISIFMGVILANLGITIATDIGASAATVNTLNTLYYVWIVVCSLTAVYFVIELGVVRTWNKLRDKKKIDLSDDEGGFK